MLSLEVSFPDGKVSGYAHAFLSFHSVSSRDGVNFVCWQAGEMPSSLSQ